MKTLILFLTALTFAWAPIDNGEKKQKADQAEREPAKIQVAILLDTSNSMDGLIDQAKSQLWKMVNELALAKDENGHIPNIEIALYDYGNDNHPFQGRLHQISHSADDRSGPQFPKSYSD